MHRIFSNRNIILWILSCHRSEGIINLIDMLILVHIIRRWRFLQILKSVIIIIIIFYICSIIFTHARNVLLCRRIIIIWLILTLSSLFMRWKQSLRKHGLHVSFTLFSLVLKVLITSCLFLWLWGENLLAFFRSTLVSIWGIIMFVCFSGSHIAITRFGNIIEVFWVVRVLFLRNSFLR